MSAQTGQSVRDEESGFLRRARELGIDPGLLDENLRLSPLERMRQHDETVRQILAVRERLGVVGSDEA